MLTIKNTLFIGKVLLYFNTLESTNQYAIDYLSKNNPSAGTVISTYKQYAGRGQIGSKWESEPDKNISLSVILYPSFLIASNQFLLNQAISLGVLDFTANYMDKAVKVKWPNDIYVENEKIAGILIQNSIYKHKIKDTIAGIGININQKQFLSDAPNPTSFALQTQKSYDLDLAVEHLCQCLEKRYLQLKHNDYKQIKADYLHHLYRFMEDGLYQRPNGDIFNARIIGISDQGKLMLNHDQGEEQFGIKEVKFL